MISVDTVYQTVLAILNKEQRGFITPQEFNLFANHAQIQIFEQYFYDLEYFESVPGNQTEYADMIDLLYDKIGNFEETAQLTYSSGKYQLPSDLYRFGALYFNGNEIDRMNKVEYLTFTSSDTASPMNSFPIYIRTSSGIQIFGDSEFDGTQQVDCFYIKEPAEVIWNYQNVLGTAQYKATGSVNFDIHPSDIVELIVKILILSGASIKDGQLYEIAVQEELKQLQQEKI